MVNYNTSKIYKIIDNTTNKIYIGSTTATLSRRIAEHRAAYKAFINGKRSNVKSFEIIKNGDYDIVLLEECQNITNKEQLHARERYYIDNLECVNKNIPGRTSKQYREDNKEKIKEYYEANKEQLKKQMKDINYQTITCPHCNIKLMKAHKWQHQRTKKHQQNLHKQEQT